MSQRILLVEDDHAVRSLLRLLFEDEGFEVAEAATGQSALDALSSHPVDVILLDLRLPGMSGFDVCREVRKHRDTPIIIVSAQQDSHEIVAGLELGADDYVTKPFNDRELVARVRVQLRSRHREDSDHVSIGPLELRPAEGVVLKDGAPVQLTRTEFHLLCRLASQPGRVWSRQQLLDEVWDYSFEGDSRLVDTHVARLRAKIEERAGEPAHLVTVRGLGYKLVP